MTWTAWITHNGTGCPAYGMYAEVERHGLLGTYKGRVGAVHGRRVLTEQGFGWVYDQPQTGDVLRYRIWKPDAVKALERAAKQTEGTTP